MQDLDHVAVEGGDATGPVGLNNGGARFAIETYAVSLRTISLFTVVSVGKRLQSYPLEKPTFDSSSCHIFLQTPCTSSSIFLSPRCIFRVFVLTLLLLQRHTTCVVTTVKRRTVALFNLSSDDGVSSAIRQRYLLVRSWLLPEWCVCYRRECNGSICMNWVKTIAGVVLVLWHCEDGRSCGGRDRPKQLCGRPCSQHERRSGRRPIDPGPYIGEHVTPIRKGGTYL